MKKILLSIFVSLALAACTEKAERGGGASGFESATERTINENIDAMKGKPWDRTTYTTIKSKQIDGSKTLRPAQKEALESKLEQVYSTVVCDEALEIMNSRCSAKTHGRLAETMKEAGAHPKTKIYKQVSDQYAAHQAEMSFASGIGASQRVTSWDTPYDEAFETRMSKEVAAHRAKNPACEQLKSSFSEASVKNAFAGRRSRYAAAIVKLYCEGSEWTQGAENRLTSHLRKALNGKIPTDIKDQIDNFRTEHQPKDAK